MRRIIAHATFRSTAEAVQQFSRRGVTDVATMPSLVESVGGGVPAPECVERSSLSFNASSAQSVTQVLRQNRATSRPPLL